MSENALQECQAHVKALKAEVSELGRQHELRGRELSAARKHAATAVELQEELDGTQSKLAACEKALTLAQAANEDLTEKLARAEAIQDDVAALKRLVG